MANNNKILYFDNSATTKIDNRVVDLLYELNENYYGNPSSIHKMGFNAEKIQNEYLEKVCKVLNCDKNEIIFTSGGTESNNLAIKGIANTYKKQGNHLVTTYIEHSSVYKVFKELENEGFDVTYLSVDRDGQIDLQDLKNSINEKTILVSIMHINNIIGSINDLYKIGNIIKEKNKNTVFHSDAVQSFSKYFVDVKKAKLDMFSVSSHKFCGPKGVGLLYKNKNIRIKPEILGGGQQAGLRSGTINVIGNIMMMKAFLLMYEEREEIYSNLSNIHSYFIDELNKMNDEYKDIYINTKNNDLFSKYIVSASFKGIKSEVLLHSLEEDNIYVSSGSACSSHQKVNGDTLSSIGLNKDLIDSTIRFSFSKYTTIDEVKILVENLRKRIEFLRKYHK